MSPVISTTANQYSLTQPAHYFKQGGRDVYFFTLTLETLDGLLPQRVDDGVVKDANRRLTPSHAKNIQQYLNDKNDWILGAMMLGIAPDAVEFEPYPPSEGEPASPNFGELRIRTNRINTMRIFDGQHRRRAVQDILEFLGNQQPQSEKLDALRKSSMSIILYAENNIGTLRQMFVDASKTKPPEGHTVTRFNQRDAFNRVAEWIVGNSRIFNGRVEMDRSSVPASSQCLVSINQLASILKSVEVGYGKRVSREMNDDYLLDLDALQDRCRIWADDFLPSSRSEYQGLLNGEIDNDETPTLRRLTFAYNVTFIRVLAGCYKLWVAADMPWEQLADFIRKASIERGKNQGLLAEAGLINPDGMNLFARRQEVDRAINYIIAAAKSATDRS